MCKPAGFILYRGPSLIGTGTVTAIATLESSNIKTGNMIQVWILPDDRDPLAALQSNTNAAACGVCPLQGWFDKQRGKLVDRVCYVNVGQAPKQIYRSLKSGRYAEYDHAQHADYLRGREIRIGAYGDPAALPTSLVRYLSRIGSSWTGYSHQLFWIDQRRAKALSRVLMASCHTPAQHAEAKRRGWRSFVAIRPEQARPDGAVECPNYSHGVQCRDCRLCQGTSKRARDIYVIAHGAVGANLGAVQTAQGESL